MFSAWLATVRAETWNTAGSSSPAILYLSLIHIFIVSERLREKIGDALIYSDVYGSDHCPVGLVLDV